MIGDIIKEQRMLKNMSRKTLSEGICSEKYVYLIEKNKRNPSAYILNQFSERMGIDLFEYYQYLNYKNKILVSEYKKKFERYSQLGDIEKLKEEGLRASQLEDFKHEPLSYEIIIIDLTYRALIEGKTGETIKKIQDILKIKKLNIDNLTLINGHVLLSTCYQIEGQLAKAKKAIEVAYDMIKNKIEFSRYNTIIITVMISLISLLYSEKEYNELIRYSKSLLEFQEKHNEYNRIYYADFYLSFGYYKTNELYKSEEHFMRGIYSALLFKNKLDLDYIMKTKEFNEIVDKLGINQYLINQLYKIKDPTDNLIKE